MSSRQWVGLVRGAGPSAVCSLSLPLSQCIPLPRDQISAARLHPGSHTTAHFLTCSRSGLLNARNTGCRDRRRGPTLLRWHHRVKAQMNIKRAAQQDCVAHAERVGSGLQSYSWEGERQDKKNWRCFFSLIFYLYLFFLHFYSYFLQVCNKFGSLR